MNSTQTESRVAYEPKRMGHTDEWNAPKPTQYRCKVYLIPEEEGGFSVISTTLPGVASQGETEQEALENITEAFEGAIAVYKEQGRSIPWDESPSETEPQAIHRVVFVNA